MAYSWICTQESFLMMIGGPYVVLGLNPGWPHQGKFPTHCIFALDLRPKFLTFMFRLISPLTTCELFTSQVRYEP